MCMFLKIIAAVSNVLPVTVFLQFSRLVRTVKKLPERKVTRLSVFTSRAGRVYGPTARTVFTGIV